MRSWQTLPFNFLLCALALLILVGSCRAALAEYSVDAHTLHLWHLDEADAPGVDATPGGSNLASLSGGATLGNPSFPGFGTALDTRDGGQAGTDSAQRDAALSALPPVNGADDNVLMPFADSVTGAFTFEAIVRVDFDPTLDMGPGGTGRGSSMQIISGDGDVNSERLFQWRLNPVGVGSGNTAVPRLEFINLRQGAGIQSLIVPIPTTGDDAIVSNEWYHAAVAYNGSEGASDNLSFYWTRLDTNVPAANLIGSGSLDHDLSPDVACDFVVGNEGRDTGGASDNWIGLIDEVRISSGARAANEFVFRSVSLLGASAWQVPNFPENTLDGDLGTRWSAQGDGQWITFDLGRVEQVQSVDIAFYLGDARTSTFDVLLSSDNVLWEPVLTNVTSSGTKLDLESFELPDGLHARYVRIVGHGNSQSDWNSLTEVEIQSLPAGDSDADGLPDYWEIFYFSNVTTHSATNDPDADLFDNIAEYLGSSNPTNALSTPLDTDADDLPDSWERLWFASLVHGPGDDPDEDEFTNAEELAEGTNPNDAASNPNDTDADGMPDVWEELYFSSLDELPSGDFDGDGFSNLEEFEAGSLPNDASSVPENVFVRYFPIDDGDTNTSEYAFAGSSAINAVAFIRSALLTVSNQQFIAYYGRHQTDPSYAFNNTIWIGRRTLGSGLWEVFRTSYTANNINDGHDVVSFALDGDGYLHMSWGMHGDAFHYSKSAAPVTGNEPIEMGPDVSMTGDENTVTYPQWLTLPEGDLLYLFREGGSGAGDVYLNRYDHQSQAWTNIHYDGGQQPFLKGRGWSPDYNPYPNMPQLDESGTLFLTWTWRYEPAGNDSPANENGYQTNHDFEYARSPDGGRTWLRQNGTSYALPISQDGESGDPDTMAETILPIPEGHSLINQAGMCLDERGDPVIASWWAPGTPTNNFRRQYMVVFPGTDEFWEVRQVSSRTNDPTNIRYAEGSVRDLGRPVVVCDDAGRIIVLYRDNFGSNGLTIVHSLPRAVDPDRQVWITFDLTTDNLGSYEPVIDLARWERDSVLSILYQPSSGLGYSPPANNASQIGVLEWDAGSYFQHVPELELAAMAAGGNARLRFHALPSFGYRLRTGTDLSEWPSLGTWFGTNGLVELEHIGGGNGPLRFWRLDYQEGVVPNL